MKTIIAIDPGKHGGMAVNALGKTWCAGLPESDGDRLELLEAEQYAAGREGLKAVVVLELVGGFIGRRQPGAAMFKFGQGYGFLIGVVMALRMPLFLIRPQQWQKGFGLGTRSACASDAQWKNKLKEEAQRRFPELKVTRATADALLILEYVCAERPEIFT